MAAKFELYKDAKGEFRWRLKASNGQTIATGGEGYSSKASARNVPKGKSVPRGRSALSGRNEENAVPNRSKRPRHSAGRRLK